MLVFMNIFEFGSQRVAAELIFATADPTRTFTSFLNYIPFLTVGG